jgi:hypothetical protein
MTTNRRDFLRLGFFSSLALSSGASLALLTGCAKPSGPAAGFRHLRPADVALLQPLMPVLLAGALAEDDDGAAPLHAIDGIFDSLPRASVEAYFKLLDLLQLGAARWYFTGTWAAFGEQSREQLNASVTAWQNSDSGFARLALRAMVQPTMMAWYSLPEAAATTGYPGPPRKLT